jgi:hypothetical protein
MNKTNFIALGVFLLILSIPLESQAQEFRIRVSSYPGIHGSIIVPQSGNRGYNYRGINDYGQGNNYYSRQGIVVEQDHRGDSCHCSDPYHSYPYQYNQGMREYYHPNSSNYSNYYSPLPRR